MTTLHSLALISCGVAYSICQARDSDACMLDAHKMPFHSAGGLVLMVSCDMLLLCQLYCQYSNGRKMV
jgi:hypothetical protein